MAIISAQQPKGQKIGLAAQLRRAGTGMQGLVAGTFLAMGLAACLPLAALTFPEAAETVRTSQREQQVQQVRPDNYDLIGRPVTDDNVRHWRSLLWTTALVEPQEGFVADAIAGILPLSSQTGLSPGQQQVVEMALQVGTQLYLVNSDIYAPVGDQFRQVINQSRNPKWVGMAFSALMQSSIDGAERQALADLIRQRFPRWSQNVHLYTTLKDANLRDREPELPPLKDLINWTIVQGESQMYVICSRDRGDLCQTVLKDGQGQFVREGGELWSVPLLLRTLHHGLAWNFTRGETPQGIYRIEGTRAPERKTFRAFGAFPLVKLFIPYESGVKSFVPGKTGSLQGGLGSYRALLPPSWRNYFPIQQSYWAGKAGRSLFRIHGSGESPNFFSNNRRFPESLEWNPTIGCLSAIELYDRTGRLQQADMPKILQALRALGGQDFTGYLIVVDVPGNPAALTLQEIETAIATASQP